MDLLVLLGVHIQESPLNTAKSKGRLTSFPVCVEAWRSHWLLRPWALGPQLTVFVIHTVFSPLHLMGGVHMVDGLGLKTHAGGWPSGHWGRWCSCESGSCCTVGCHLAESHVPTVALMLSVSDDVLQASFGFFHIEMSSGLCGTE